MGFAPIVTYHVLAMHPPATLHRYNTYVTDFSSVWTPVICSLAANFKVKTGTGTYLTRCSGASLDTFVQFTMAKTELLYLKNVGA